jgi:hypothetical protein
VGTIPTRHLAQVPPADLDIPIVGQLALPEFSLGDALEPGSLEVLALNATVENGPLGRIIDLTPAI